MPDFKRELYTLENGNLQAYAFPGGYPIYYITADSGILCPACANLPECTEASSDCPDDKQWQIVAAECNYEDPALFCDHCSKRIESAYAETEYGIMTKDCQSVGTTLRLQEGQVVAITPATNLPQGGYFARPSDGKWSDGIDHGPDDSILITGEDFDSAPNLDCMSEGDLHTFSQTPRNPAPLREYAAIKARAMEARKAGRIQQAVKWESACDKLYKLLPKCLQW